MRFRLNKKIHARCFDDLVAGDLFTFPGSTAVYIKLVIPFHSGHGLYYAALETGVTYTGLQGMGQTITKLEAKDIIIEDI